MFKVTYRPMWLGVLFTCLFIQMFVLLVTQVTIIKDYLGRIDYNGVGVCCIVNGLRLLYCIVFYGVISSKDAKRATGFSSSRTFSRSTKLVRNIGALLTLLPLGKR